MTSRDAEPAVTTAVNRASDHPSFGDRPVPRARAADREADLHELAAERFLALGDVVRAERERTAANRLRDEAARSSSRTSG